MTLLGDKPIGYWWWGSHGHWYHWDIVVVWGTHVTVLHYLAPLPSFLVPLPLLLLLLDPVPLILTPCVVGWRTTIHQLV